MAERWGHIINEVPELWEALRVFELQNRAVRGGFKIAGDAGVSMDGGAAGRELRIQVGNT
ncbi:hypothetical protein ASD54_07670 [Rhizobium sp. Root149]|nr:hypothetical protein ASD54_07670 [Rhizobium sp. Root149]